MANIEEPEPPQENEQLPPIDIQRLPDEVLTIIFNYLDDPGKGRVAQVSRHWLQVSRQKSVWHGVAVKVHLKGEDLMHTFITTRLFVLRPKTDSGQPTICLPYITHVFFSMSDSVQILENIPCIHYFALKFPNLVTLSLNFQGMSDYDQFLNAAIGVLCDHLKFIRHLYLSSILITDEGIAILAGQNSAHEGFPLLETLELHLCTSLTGQSLVYISTLHRLQHLKLFTCSNIFYNKGFQFLSRLPRLARLSVINCDDDTGAASKHLTRMETLRELHLDMSFGGDMGLSHLVDAGSKITSLEVTNNSVITRWSLLNQLSNLQSLTVSFSGITDAALETLSTTSQIQKFDLNNCRSISDYSLKHLAKMGSLRQVNLNYCNVSDRGLAYLAQGKSGIAYLTIGTALVTNEGMKHLVGLENLTALILINCINVWEEGLGYLGQSTAQVTQLTVAGVNDFNSSMAHYILRHLTGLRQSKLNRLYIKCTGMNISINDLINRKLFEIDNVDFTHLFRKYYRKEQHWQISFRKQQC